jgi:hypothetical protein
MSYGRAVSTSTDPEWYAKRYYDWRVEFLRGQPLIRDIHSDVLGVPSKGIQAILRGPTGGVRLGGKLPVTLVLKNTSKRDVRLPFKYRFGNECGLTTLIDGPNGRVPYRWQLDPDLGHCQATTPTPDWNFDALPMVLRPGETYELSFDLSDEFDISIPGQYEIVVSHPLPDLTASPLFDPMNVQQYATSNKITVTVY